MTFTTANFYERNRYLILGSAVCLFPVLVFAAAKSLQVSDNDVRKWLPQGHAATAQYDWFCEKFGNEDFVVVSWLGCNLDDPRLEQFAELLESKSSPLGPEASQYVSAVLTGQRSLDTLTNPPLRLTRHEALARMRGYLIGPHREQSCAIVEASEQGRRDPYRLLALIRACAERIGISGDALRMAGPPVTNVAVDHSSNTSMKWPLGFALIAGTCFSWFCFRCARLTISVVAVGAASALASLAIVWFSGNSVNAVLLMMPPLVYVSTTSGAIHLANYYHDAVKEGGVSGASGRATLHALLPLGLAIGTTSLGLLSLCVSELLPIRLFGFYSAVGVALSFAWLMFYLPAFIACAAPSSQQTKREFDAVGQVSNRWQRWGGLIVRHQRWVTLGSLFLATMCGIGLYWVKTSVEVDQFFQPDAKFARDSLWLEENLGAMVPMEVVIRIESACTLNMLQRMELIRRLQGSIGRLDEVGVSLSAANFSPRIPGHSDGGWSLSRSVMNRRLERNRDQLSSTRFYLVSEQEELWRISLRAKSFHQVDYRFFTDAIRGQVEPILTAELHRGVGGISAVYTGMVPLINQAQQSLLEGLIKGLGIDLFLVATSIAFFMGHWSIGIAVLITSIFPVIVVVGIFTWNGIPLDIGSVLTPCVALGVSVDDVLHFIFWFRQGLRQGMDRQKAVQLAYDNCGRAMFQSWCVLGLGLSFFAFSEFIPTHRFGVMMVCLLTASLLGNLVLLPALLVGPLGKNFAKNIDPVPSVPRM